MAGKDRPFASAMMALSTKSATNGTTSIERVPITLPEQSIETKRSAKYADLDLVVKHQKFLDIVTIITKNELSASFDLSKRMIELMKVLNGDDPTDGILESLLATMTELLSTNTVYSKSIIDI